jgi:hypothetical protein
MLLPQSFTRRAIRSTESGGFVLIKSSGPHWDSRVPRRKRGAWVGKSDG